MTVPNRYYETEPGYEGDPTYTPQVPGEPAVEPISVSPASSSPMAATPPLPTPAGTAPIAVPALPTPQSAPTALPVPIVLGTPRYLADDYARAAKALMPRGLAWSDEPSSVQHQTLMGIGKAFERLDAVLSGILAGSVPGSLTALLPEWEASLGLPDPCLGGAPSIAQRLNQVRGRFTGLGGQSRQHFIDFAAALGFTITITVYKPGQQTQLPPSSMAANDIGWMFTWGVTVTAINGALPVEVLMCELEAIKPAETTVLLLSSPVASPLLSEANTALRSETGSMQLNETFH